MNEPYLIWSHEHHAWWRQAGLGYTPRLSEAGVFTREVALRICRRAIPGTSTVLGALPALPVRFDDVTDITRPYLDAHPGRKEPWL